MGFHAPSIWQLLLVFLIILLLFGAKKLKTLGSDLGSAVKGFRSSMKEGEEGAAASSAPTSHEKIADHPITDGRVVNAQASKEKEPS